MWYSKVGKHLADEDIIAEEGDGLWKYGVVVIEGGGNDPLIEDEVSQDIDQEDFSLGNGEAKEVDGDFISRGAKD